MVQELFDNHTLETFMVSKGVLVRVLCSPWDEVAIVITKHLLMKKHPSYLFTPHLRFMTAWKKGEEVDKEVRHPAVIQMIINSCTKAFVSPRQRKYPPAPQERTPPASQEKMT